MARFKMVNNDRIQLTAEEEAQLDADQVIWEAGAFDREIADLRRERNSRISITDWHGLSDVTMSAAMTQYRQDLRDLPSGLTTVEEVKAVVWPTPPAS
jgi:hypothetical protein|tara:strand:+ start:141 stop:434 length:294 start_codon:yes stop_codon:yes gene_type:complete